MDWMVWALGPITAAVALFVVIILVNMLRKESSGNEKMRWISEKVQEGAIAFLTREYKTLVIFVSVVAIFLAVLGFAWEDMTPYMAISFVAGAICSALSGYIGMRVATSANAKTAEGARHSLNKGLTVAFRAGSVMGLTVVGLGLMGISLVFALFYIILDIGDPDLIADVDAWTANWNYLVLILFSFGFGASSIALFARVGGGIYTKAADVGADLVGKVEAGIPEDDPRNPASIADNVGDNVGDIAGMGADLFESYVDSIIAAIALSIVFIGWAHKVQEGDPEFLENLNIYVIIPILIAGAGIIASLVGIFLVRTSSEKPDQEVLLMAIRRGIYLASVVAVIIAVVFVYMFTGDLGGFEGVNMKIIYALITGLMVGILIGYMTEYFTSDVYKPTQDVADAAKTGPATIIIAGISVSMMSTFFPVIFVAVGIVVANELAGLYGIAIAAVGMLSTLGVTLSTDAYGPVADNAGGIAEGAGLEPEVRERTDALDSLGNTTAATGKGFAIGSAALTALALVATYNASVGLDSVDISKAHVMAGLFIGAMLPFLFSSLTMGAVGRAAMSIVQEVRRQFKENPGLLEGTVEPDSKRVVDIATAQALREMVLPGIIVIVAPIAVGLVMGPEALGGLLAGSLASGFLLAVMMANAGGSWDNAKKWIEKGNLGGKGSDEHKAAVVGDTVGDPFKDTSGPSLNILIKLMSIVALVFAPLF
jgi:K(+)-stimulated pyrophosphate-energized sodium pump